MQFLGRVGTGLLEKDVGEGKEAVVFRAEGGARGSGAAAAGKGGQGLGGGKPMGKPAVSAAPILSEKGDEGLIAASVADGRSVAPTASKWCLLTAPAVFSRPLAAAAAARAPHGEL